MTLKYLHEMPVTWLHCIHLLYDKIAQITPLCNTAILAACLKLQLATINNFKNRSWQNMRCHQTLNVILIWRQLCCHVCILQRCCLPCFWITVNLKVHLSPLDLIPALNLKFIALHLKQDTVNPFKKSLIIHKPINLSNGR